VGAGSGGGVDSDAYWDWIRDSIAQNKPYSQLARERLAAQGYDGPSRHYPLFGKVAPVETLVAEQLRLFLGRRLDCAQCHNHPYESWSQNQFWGLAAFFGGMKATLREGTNQVIYDDSEGQEVDYDVQGTTLKIIHPRSGEEVPPTFLDGRVLPESRRFDRRMELAKWMTSHPSFAEAIVNRMWSYFFGRGIVDPVDDFRLTAPPTHPELLQALARDFEQHGYDLKHLIRMIVSSTTYQLSSIPNETNQDDTINYSHALPRPLVAEVLLDVISSVTGVPEIFSRVTARAPFGTRAINIKVPHRWPTRFLEIYGWSLREELPERDGSPTLSQALHRLVGSAYTEKLFQKGSRLDQLLEKGISDRKIIEELYLVALSRFPSQEERTELEQMIGQRSSRRQAFENFLWALISSREFAHNH
jgi:hypothetical protein